MYERSPDWFLRDKGTLATVWEYFDFLNTFQSERPDLDGLVTCCPDCDIPFLTHPRNRGRRDIRCPFGCRKAHYKEDSAKRSLDYYRSPAGKEDKKWHNQQRAETAAVNETRRSGQTIAAAKVRIETVSLSTADLVALLKPYLGVALSLIERRSIAEEEITRLVHRVRQRSIDAIKATGYGARCPKKKPR